ncbi:MAG: T9SS type A sorting domain-containing protein [Phaeodactylibacter sp.]|nr:T9SS type A sorting domain-containing protein [Phaeodactylibacter sp.]
MAVLILAVQSFAQITVERSDYLLTTDGATVQNWYLQTDGLALPAEGAAVEWDFSGQAFAGTFTYTKTPVSEPLFPTANLVEYTTGTALNLVEQGVNYYEELADDGYKVQGRSTSGITLPASPLTGGANDTINFLGNVSVYDEPIYYLKFPLNYEDNWATEINIQGNYLITVAAFGLDHVPASSNYNYAETNAVAGYGTLILPHPDGTGTVSLEALLLKSTTVRTDSFYLAGQPAPQLMLDALGLVQGNISTNTSYSFYAKGLNRSALVVGSKNGQITSVSMADDVKNSISSTQQVAYDLLDVAVFPNPTSGTFQIAFEKTDGKAWQLDLFDPLGRLVQQQVVETSGKATRVEVSLSGSIPAGVYVYILRDAAGVIRGRGQVLRQ